MKTRPAEITDPHRIAEPENCIDSGGFYLRFERPSTAKEIDKDVLDSASSTQMNMTEQAISRAVTNAINGAYIDAEKKLEYIREAKKILL